MIINLTKQNIISFKPYFVCGVIANIRGMIKRRFSDFDAVVFQNTRGLHTLKNQFMKLQALIDPAPETVIPLEKTS